MRPMLSSTALIGGGSASEPTPISLRTAQHIHPVPARSAAEEDVASGDSPCMTMRWFAVADGTPDLARCDRLTLPSVLSALRCASASWRTSAAVDRGFVPCGALRATVRVLARRRQGHRHAV